MHSSFFHPLFYLSAGAQTSKFTEGRIQYAQMLPAYTGTLTLTLIEESRNMTEISI